MLSGIEESLELSMKILGSSVSGALFAAAASSAERKRLLKLEPHPRNFCRDWFTFSLKSDRSAQFQYCEWFPRSSRESRGIASFSFGRFDAQPSQKQMFHFHLFTTKIQRLTQTVWVVTRNAIWNWTMRLNTSCSHNSPWNGNHHEQCFSKLWPTGRVGMEWAKPLS